MKLITKHNCFNDKYMLHKGSEIEVVREFECEGETCLVFREVDSLTDGEHEEFRCTKNNPNFEEVAT